MAAINWGYAINKPRVIDIDSNNLRSHRANHHAHTIRFFASI